MKLTVSSILLAQPPMHIDGTALKHFWVNWRLEAPLVGSGGLGSS